MIVYISNMTAQITDILNYQDMAHSICNEPLSKILKDRSIKFHTPHTALWRGYTGTWRLIEDKLYLVGIKAYLDEKSIVDLNYLFPNHKEVFADWFTGEIKINLGKLIEYRHFGYASIYEKNIFLAFENGVLKSQRTHNNNSLLTRIRRRIMKMLLSNNEDDYGV